METNEISMFVDVKIDINERKNETGRLKNWLKCFVKIEAIKSLPCFLRLTFIRNVEDESENFNVPIHVPGVQIRLTNSRSKTFSYGLTWKQSRKRCHVFFAFDNQLNFERHMKWLKESLKNLDLHRRDTRRESREIEQTKFFEKKNSVDELHRKNLQAFLGPLPKVPDPRDSFTWSRRISTTSGIYEEINESINFRRISQTSGIYEEMKAPKDVIMINQGYSPPGTLGRDRINTFENEFFEAIPRSCTNPESMLEAEKNKHFFNGKHINIFGRLKKRCESVSECKVSTTKKHEEMISNNEDYDKHIYVNLKTNFEKTIEISGEQEKNMDFNNFFESTDLLQNDTICTTQKENHLMSITSNIQDFCKIDKSAVLKNTGSREIRQEYDSMLNVSERINETFNFSINSSTVNLAGANFNMENTDLIKTTENNVSKLIDDGSGYCTMVPILTSSLKNINKINDDNIFENDIKQDRTFSESDKENIYDKLKPKQFNEINLQYCENIIDPFTSNNSQNYIAPLIKDLDSLPNKSLKRYDQTSKKSLIKIDEKISSYYSNSNDNSKLKNEDISTNTNNIKLRSFAETYIRNFDHMNFKSLEILKNNKMEQSGHNLNKNSEATRSTNKVIPIKPWKITDNAYSIKTCEDKETKVNKHNQIDLFLNNPEKPKSPSSTSFETLLKNIDFKFDDIQNLKYVSNLGNTKSFEKFDKSSQQLIPSPTKKSSPEKTISEYENNQTFNKTTSSEISSIKKISSLQRLKRIDFSPLKFKINNVLQRNNSS